MSGNGCSSTDDNTITSKAIKYKDLRKLVIASDNIIEESKGRCLYGGGRHGQTRQKKRKRMNDNDDHDDQDDDDEKKELATQANMQNCLNIIICINNMKENDYVTN